MSDSPRPDPIIRITAADLTSPHVDDLLSRQASLRGETGLAAHRKRAWYYSNWFVFLLAGIFGAFLAWAILEPYFDDLLYVQGTIEELKVEKQEPQKFALGEDREVEIAATAVGMMVIDGEEIMILPITRPFGSQDPKATIDPDALKVGQEVGVYLEYERGAPAAMAAFIDTKPPAGQATHQSLSSLAARDIVAGLLLFPLVSALVGLSIGAADGLVCRLWRRVLLGGGIGLVVGFIGGFFCQILAGLVYAPLNALAMQQQGQGVAGLSTFGFLTQVGGRGLAWSLAGIAMGLGQGLSLRSTRLLLYGFLGGAIGGLVGGLLFDPIALILVGPSSPSAHWSRMVGLCVIGMGVGLMIGIVELLARDAWLHMVQGPLAGKEFLVFKDLLQIGSSPRSDVYLFNDDQVAGRHAIIRSAADQYEIESVDQFYPVLVNGRPISRARLRHGDQITLGKTVFLFHRRRTD
jgi:hypothetical protein